jgi:hypothetical protein
VGYRRGWESRAADASSFSAAATGQKYPGIVRSLSLSPLSFKSALFRNLGVFHLLSIAILFQEGCSLEARVSEQSPDRHKTVQALLRCFAMGLNFDMACSKDESWFK